VRQESFIHEAILLFSLVFGLVLQNIGRTALRRVRQEAWGLAGFSGKLDAALYIYRGPAPGLRRPLTGLSGLATP
jgi:hypothetical protein